MQCALLFPGRAVKRAALYVAGVLWLTLLFSAERLSFKCAEWRKRLQRQNVSPQSYTWERFNREVVVYIRAPGASSNCSRRRFSLGSSMFYVGSTKVGLFEREYARARKHDQLFSSSFVQAEPAVKWWFSCRNFYEFVPIVLEVGRSYPEVWTLEHLFVQNWRPPLNFPFSNRLVFKEDGVTSRRVARQHACVAARSGRRLFLKLRRRSKALRKLVTEFGPRVSATHVLSRSNAWSILFFLSQHNGQGWQMQKLLAGQATAVVNLYALARLANSLEEPYRGVAKKRLRAVLEIRGLGVPRLAKPLCLPLLANKMFKKNVEAWIVKIRKLVAEKALPFHLPTKQVVEKRHTPVGNRLFNFRGWMKRFSRQPCADFCRCHMVLQKHPGLLQVEGHVASPAALMSVSKHLKRLLSFSAGSCFFPRMNAYRVQSLKEIQKWAAHHHLPVEVVEVEWGRLLEKELPAHAKSVTGRFSVADVLRVCQEMEHLVCHCRDHAYQQVMVFCPQLYKKVS